MKVEVRSYFNEAKWFHQKRIPTINEYMRLAIVTSGYLLLEIISLAGMGDIVTKDSFEWMLSYPKSVRASLVLSRLKNDMVSHKVLCYFCTTQ
jgi:(-)-germacrene D synthase